jgi:tetratricopeptide (TPR) repeat protein
LQSFYYEELGSKERQEMHRRIGGYYESTEPDVMQAALHFERATDYAKSAQLATENVLALINLFQAPVLGHLLDRLDELALSPEQKLQVKLARGQVYGVLGDKPKARANYETAITQLQSMAKSRENDILFARACRGLSSQFEDPKEARSWLLKGLERLVDKGVDEEMAPLLIALGGVEASMEHFEQARKILEDALAKMEPSPSPLRGDALNNLLLIYFAQGDLKTALSYSNQVLANTQALDNTLNNRLDEQKVLGNSALIKFTLGYWKDALVDLEAAVQLSKQLMDRPTQTALTTNLGIANLKMGDHAAAKEHLNAALELAQANQLRFYELTVLCGLASLHVQLREWQPAEDFLQRAEELAKDLGEQDKEIVVYRTWAELRLATAAHAEAIDFANRSIEVARTLAMKNDQAMGLRVLGQILAASGSLPESEDALKTSLGLLDESDKYETARTQLELGKTLLQRGQAKEGQKLIDVAHAKFDELGVQYE